MVGFSNFFGGNARVEDLQAIGQSVAMISFDMTGRVIDANGRFLEALGYSLEDIRGQHHRMFVDEADRDVPEYAEFWKKLGAGEFVSGQFRRRAADGREIWIRASYNPILDRSGRPVRVVKIAFDITAECERLADLEDQRAAIDRSQAVIEFDLDGTIRHANANFLAVLGYSLDEIVGQDHRMFVDPAESSQGDYAKFWSRLGKGEYDAGQYRRIGKGGRELWIQASYSPVLDASGRPYKIIKFATDITASHKGRALADAVSEANAVIGRAKKNDLTGRIPLHGKEGEIATLCVGVNDLLETMSTMVASVGSIADAIDGSSASVATNSSALSGKVDQTGARLAECAATTEELAGSVRATSGSAAAAVELGREATEAAARGNEIVAETTEAMRKIEVASRSIGEIIGVIDGISFQTKLLALNAAVEAARAGDAGRGFAVVASEVRALADRSATAAKSVKDLITRADGQIQVGVGLAADAGAALRGIMSSVGKVSNTLVEISSAAGEQAKGIEEIARAVAELDDSAQVELNLAGEGAETAQLLASESKGLSDLVASFVLTSTSEQVRIAA